MTKKESMSIIEVDHLDIAYENGHHALSNISVSISANKITGLVGKNGAGKSTLFQAIMGFLPQAKGTIKIANKPIKTALKERLVAYVPQSDQIDWHFPLLVHDVVMMGRYANMGLLKIPSPQDKQLVDEVIEKVGLQGLQKRPIAELSGGQKKRMFLARALAQLSPIILMDEPFAGIDSETELSLIQLFKQIAHEGKTLLVSTHNLGSVPNFCDDVILLNQSLIATGAVEQVFTQEQLAIAFGGMLRHLNVPPQGEPQRGHELDKPNEVTVLTDDERPLVLFGEERQQTIVK